MLKKFFIISSFFAMSFGFAAIADAQVPSRCLNRDGSIDCSKRSCQDYCRPQSNRPSKGNKQMGRNNKGPNHKDVRHNRNRPNAPSKRPVNQVRVKSPDFYEAEIQRLHKDNINLQRQLDRELANANVAYQNCIRWNPFNQRMCSVDNTKSAQIRSRIRRNNRRIEENKGLQREALRNYRSRR